MKIAILIKFGKKYSGGRYHGWMIAESLSIKNKIDVFCDNKPIFLKDFDYHHKQDKINFYHLNSFKNSIAYDWIIVVPSVGSIPYYSEWIKKGEKDNSKICFVNFETPNWYISVFKYSKRNDDVISYLANHSDLCLSATKIGTKYAKEYFEKNRGLQYTNIYPSINSYIKKTNQIKKKSIVILTRFGNDAFSKHKLSISLEEIFLDKFKGYDLNIIYGGEVDKKKYALLGKKFGINVILHQNISDIEKFKIISEAKFMIFLSQFEGYGYPIIESMSCDTPVFCNKLDVFLEIHSDKIFYINKKIDEYDFFNHLKDYKSYKKYYDEEFSIDNYGKKLNFILENFKLTTQYKKRSYYHYLTKFLLTANLKSKLLYLRSLLQKKQDELFHKKI